VLAAGAGRDIDQGPPQRRASWIGARYRTAPYIRAKSASFLSAMARLLNGQDGFLRRAGHFCRSTVFGRRRRVWIPGGKRFGAHSDVPRSRSARHRPGFSTPVFRQFCKLIARGICTWGGGGPPPRYLRFRDQRNKGVDPVARGGEPRRQVVVTRHVGIEKDRANRSISTNIRPHFGKLPGYLRAFRSVPCAPPDPIPHSGYGFLSFCPVPAPAGRRVIWG